MEKTFKLLVLLQNAWATGELKNGFNPRTWQHEFSRSRSGVRLLQALPEFDRRWKIHYSNASPILADHPDAVHEPNLTHIRRTLKRVRPNLVLACGKVVEQAIVGEWEGPLICVPHPACRVLTNDTYNAVRNLIIGWGILESIPTLRETQRKWGARDEILPPIPRIAVRQGRGTFTVEVL